MKLFTLIIFIINFALFADEVSVFGAGDLESSNPYGLTSAEKVILKNKKNLNKFDKRVDNIKSNINDVKSNINDVKSNINDVKSNIDNVQSNVDDAKTNIELINERIDGLESLMDGESRKLRKVAQDLKKNNQTDIVFTNKLDLLSQSQIKLKDQQAEHQKAINKVIEDFKSLDEMLKKLIDEVNKNYITKKQFDELVVFVNKELMKKTKIIVKKKKKKISNKQLLSDAIALYNKKFFTKAIPIFTDLIEAKYRPAQSNYHLGEIWYYRKKYKEAIHYFKTSMLLYDKAKYIPTLLLHSAISFEKLNDMDNAANFYGTLIDVYPESKEAQKAQKNLLNTN